MSNVVTNMQTTAKRTSPRYGLHEMAPGKDT